MTLAIIESYCHSCEGADDRSPLAWQGCRKPEGI